MKLHFSLFSVLFSTDTNNKHYKKIRKKREYIGISSMICLHVYEKQDNTIVKVQYMW